MTQPDAWAQAIEVGQSTTSALHALWERISPSEVIFTGCGSTYYLSIIAAALARTKGISAKAVPASELWLLTKSTVLNPEKTLLVTVSRSGTTTETLRAVDAFRSAGGRAVVAATNYPQETLARAADLTLAAPLGQEKSIAQTRSFASMVVLCQAIVNAARPDPDFAARLAPLPGLGRKLIASYGELAQRLGNDATVQRFFFLGNGALYGLACEAMLKMKEMSLSYSEAYHMLEFRHGPKSMVDTASLVVGLLGEEAQERELAVLADMRAIGGRTLTLGESPAAQLPGDIVRLASGLSVADRLVLYLPVLQLLAFYRSIAKGLDPDAPNNLTAVVTL
jgi:glucosamine--fructose-6-phosphate aminotransferase (isomerizing)